MSSIWRMTPSKPASNLFIILGKCFGAHDIPNGSLLKQYRSKGVMKVVSRRDSSANGTCQKPLLASILENIVAPDNKASVVSTLGSG